MSADVNVKKQFVNGLWSRCPATPFQKARGQTVHWSGLFLIMAYN